MNISDVLAGLAHPLSGADHVLAMIAVGLWGAVAGGRALWAWPAAFVTMVATGFAMAVLGVELPLVEPAIVSSIVVFGLLIAMAVRMPVTVGAMIVGAFALFHGHAHGTEAAETGMGLIGFAMGFSLATAMLHVLGLGMGLALSRTARVIALRVVGMAVAIGGLLAVNI
jgi:urease accessory protein